MKQHINWKKVKLEPGRLKELTKSSDLKGFLQVIPHILITVILGVLTFYAFNNWALYISIPIFLLYATFYSFFGYTAAIHELTHRTVFKTKWLNEFFLIIFGIMTWNDYVYIRKSHMQHHAYTTFEGLDGEVEQPIDVSFLMMLQAFTISIGKIFDKKFGIIPIFTRAFGMLRTEREKELFGNDEKMRKKMFAFNRLMLLVHFTVVVIIILTKSWIFLLLFTFAAFFGNWYNALVGLTQHAGLGSNLDDFRQNSRSINLGPIGEFLYWRMNYHIEHHMYASIPFYNLRKFYLQTKEYMPERKGLIGAWKEIIAAEKQRKKNKDYFIEVKVKTI